MRMEELLFRIRRLPAFRQQEVMDFVRFLEQRSGQSAEAGHADWSDETFQAMSIDQAMRGFDDEADLYSEADLQERWQ
jgi:hypothetical protein